MLFLSCCLHFVSWFLHLLFALHLMFCSCLKLFGAWSAMLPALCSSLLLAHLNFQRGASKYLTELLTDWVINVVWLESRSVTHTDGQEGTDGCQSQAGRLASFSCLTCDTLELFSWLKLTEVPLTALCRAATGNRGWALAAHVPMTEAGWACLDLQALHLLPRPSDPYGDQGGGSASICLASVVVQAGRSPGDFTLASPQSLEAQATALVRPCDSEIRMSRGRKWDLTFKQAIPVWVSFGKVWDFIRIKWKLEKKKS